VKFSLARGVSHFNALAGVIPCQNRHKWYIAKTIFFGLHFRCRKYWCIFNHFYVIRLALPGVTPSESDKVRHSVSLGKIWPIISHNLETVQNCKIRSKLVLITNRKSYMSFRLIPKSVTLNGVMAVTLRYFTEVGKPALQKTICGGIYARDYCIFSACTMSSQRKFTFAISSPDEFLVCYTITES